MASNSIPLRMGIAGYMGAGKSTCSSLLSAKLGMMVVDADVEAKVLMENDGRVKDELAIAFGPSIARKGVIDFKVLGNIAFSSSGEMEKLNRIVHPRLVRRLQDLICSSPNSCILDAALISFWGIETCFDSCIWVGASRSKRIERVRERTGLSEDRVRQRMTMQEALMAEPRGRSWTFVYNEGSRDELSVSLDACGINRP
jgi:dephospho-CoA kinase